MTTAYTSLLGLALPVTGELSGTWGDTVNTAITSLLDTAIAGTTSITTDSDITLTTTTGASNQARQAIILWNPASGTVTRNITAPAQSKMYTVINASGGTQSIVIRGAGPTTGVTVLKGESALVAWNGSDFVKVSSIGGTGTFTNLTVTGNTILGDATADTLTVNATVTSNLIFTDNTYDIGASGATRPRTGYFGTSLITPLVDATNLEVTNIKALDGTASITLANSTGVASFTANPILSGGTANGVAYLNGSKVLTTGSALTFDGSAFQTSLGTGLVTNTKQLVLNNFSGEGVGITFSRPTDSTEVNAIGTASSSWELGLFGREGIVFATGGGSTYSATTEQMRLTSTGLGIGTSSPSSKLQVNGNLRVEGATSEILMAVGAERTISASGSASSTALTFKRWNGSTYVNDVVMDGSGNLGIGVTPSAWTTFTSVLQIKQSSLFSYNGNTYLYSNYYYDGSPRYMTNNEAMGYAQENGAHTWYNAPSGTAGNAITFTQAMTLDASGNLQLGATSGSGNRLNVVGTGGIRVNEDGSGTKILTLRSDFAGVGPAINVTTSDPLLFLTNNTERARIDSSGNLGVGRTNPGVRLSVAGNSDSWQLALSTNSGSTGAVIGSPAADVLAFGSWAGTERARINSDGYFKASNAGTYLNSAGTYHELRSNASASPTVIIANTNASFGDYATQVDITRNSTNNSFYAIAYYNRGAGAFRLLVADSGNVTNTNGSYGTISDAKMKTDIVDSGSQWADIKAIRFRKFKMKDDPEQVVQLGVVAQELEQTSPGLVEEHTDRDKEGNDLGTTTKSVKTSVLLMKAAVALQEAMTRIEQLEARVAQLESN